MQGLKLQSDRSGRTGGTAQRGSASVAVLLLVAMHVVSAGTLAAAATVGARLEVTAERLVYGRHAPVARAGWGDGVDRGFVSARPIGIIRSTVAGRPAFSFGERVGPLHLDLPPPLG